MKTPLLLATLCLLAGSNFGQATNTISSGLNQNEVNVVRDGDFPAENGGVIKMVPNGRKAKVMTIVPDTVGGNPLSSSTQTPVIPSDSSIQFKEKQKVKAVPTHSTGRKTSNPKGKKNNPK